MKTHIAAFIVIAANSHDLLLKVAKEIEAAMALAGCPSSALVASMNAIDRLREAGQGWARQGKARHGRARHGTTLWQREGEA